MSNPKSRSESNWGLAKHYGETLSYVGAGILGFFAATAFLADGFSLMAGLLSAVSIAAGIAGFTLSYTKWGNRGREVGEIVKDALEQQTRDLKGVLSDKSQSQDAPPTTHRDRLAKQGESKEAEVSPGRAG